MTILSKTLLAVAAAGLAGGIIIAVRDAVAGPALSVVLPIGAVAFGLFLIVMVLQKEVALYDLEQKNKLESLSRNTTAAKQHSKSPPQPLIAEPKGKAL